jgi:hygromycin-B 7''-O-kinase
LNPLADFDSREFYTRHFLDLALWAPFVRQVCERHAFSAAEIRTGTPGTCPVFMVDNRWVVKFFGPLFNGAESFAAERAASRWIDQHPVLPHAARLADGQLWAGSEAGWHWPYLIFEFLDGVSLGEVFETLSESDRRQLARDLGTWLRALHDLELPATPPFEASWDRFQGFLRHQAAGCAARQAQWAALPAPLLAEIPGFLPPVDALFDPRSRPRLIHADLTGDHLLGRLEAGRWTSLGLIDFGDARAANLEYELTCLHLDLFRGSRPLLATFLEAYGFSPGPGFAQRMLAYSLLHEFNLLAPFAGRMRAGSLAGLADELWSL